MGQNQPTILREWYQLDYTPEVIKESKEKNDGKIFLTGLIQRADAVNQNGRIYPKAILEREVRNYQKFILENRALGSLDHPETSVIELKSASHLMKKVWMEGDAVYGTLQLLSTPNGKIAENLLSDGVKIGISSRAVGSVYRNNDDVDIVDESLQIICWDLVCDPSTVNAFVYQEGRALQESLNKTIYNRSDRINRAINELLYYKRTQS